MSRTMRKQFHDSDFDARSFDTSDSALPRLFARDIESIGKLIYILRSYLPCVEEGATTTCDGFILFAETLKLFHTARCTLA